MVADETSSWPYRHDRDLTGFIDGTENPSLIDAADVALIRDGNAGEAGTILLLQKWKHDTTAWESLSVKDQERVMGRRKLDSVELEDKRSNSHVASTDQDQFGNIFRRNMPYGTVTHHGTMFVGFSADQRRLATMLERMAGLRTGLRDELTRHATHQWCLLLRSFHGGPAAIALDCCLGPTRWPDANQSISSITPGRAAVAERYFRGLNLLRRIARNP